MHLMLYPVCFFSEGHNWNCKLYCALEGCTACFKGVLRNFLWTLRSPSDMYYKVV
ncbi:hypothetical protein Hanom_Chr12g01133551 [Helianthus anomalus]